ncbi:hypothetical protein L596_012306 [Steinernema carpocapsae]|uniref:Uncharacterized protein n=1 Tax=Steinernema carpocapsae TaxID=34508 RepID=A0A4U5NXI8_STECR|nr:hypothetical protein L596_012306 [Steinernema carpocapsae]
MAPKRRVAEPKAESTASSKRSKPFATQNEKKILEDLERKFIYRQTPEIMKFWSHAKSLKPSYPCEAFLSLQGMKLVGPFRFLQGESCKNDSEYVLWDRYKTDLPEMQTIATYEGGRFAFWRDNAEDEPILVHVEKTENFPKVEIVGSDDPFFAVAFLADDKEAGKLLPEGKGLEEYKKTLKAVVQKRKKESMGDAFHGPKIVVPLRGEVGYRPVSDNPGKLKKKLKTFMTTDDENLKATLRKELLELKSYIDISVRQRRNGLRNGSGIR